MAQHPVKVNLVAEVFVPKPGMFRIPPPVDVDAHVRLSGNEDCGVDVQCGTCDRGGEPVAWYAGPARFDPPLYPNPYDETRVPTARTIYQLYALAYQHVRETHTEQS